MAHADSAGYHACQQRMHPHDIIPVAATALTCNGLPDVSDGVEL